MNQRRVAVEGKDDRLVLREEVVEVAIGEPVRVLAFGLQFHQIDDVHHSDLQLWQAFAQHGHSRECLQSRNVTAAGHDHIGRNSLVIAGPLPDANSLAAMQEGGFHGQPLRRRVLARDNDVHVVAAAQAVIHHREQAVRVRR